VKPIHAWILVGCATLLFTSSGAHAQAARQPDWRAIEAETMEHYLALLRLDTSDPPGREQPAVDYLKSVLERDGIPVETFTLEPNRPNLVARLKGSGRKRPVLIMGHTDVVNVDPAKWTYPPFSATRAGGYVYGRGTRDDKDNVVAGLMILLTLKRLGIPLDRDVIFLAEAGEEGSTRVGIQFMVNQHFATIDAEYCLAEAGPVARVGVVLKYAGLARAVRALTDWQPPIASTRPRRRTSSVSPPSLPRQTLLGISTSSAATARVCGWPTSTFALGSLCTGR
jgi:hypothetical protein